MLYCEDSLVIIVTYLVNSSLRHDIYANGFCIKYSSANPPLIKLFRINF